MVQQEPADRMLTEYRVGDQSVKLSMNIVRKYLVNSRHPVTDQEIGMFISLCKYQHLNPFIREAYLIKYSPDQPATIVTGKDAFMKRAYRNPNFDGQEAGIILFHEESGEIEYRIGSMRMPDERLIGGWARVYVKGYEVPIYAAVSCEEYAQNNQQWRSKPATMIRKVALVQALREAFPVDLGGMYTSDEMGTDDLDEVAIAPAGAPQRTQPQEPQQPEILEDPQQVQEPPQTSQRQNIQNSTDDSLNDIFK
jgi:phage recombination protein Bet